mgnify:FL=1
MAKRRPLPRRTKTDKILRHLIKDKAIHELESPLHRRENPSFAGRAYAASMLGDQHPLAEEGDDPAKIEVRMRIADKLKRKAVNKHKIKQKEFEEMQQKEEALKHKHGWTGPNFGDSKMMERLHKKKFGNTI